MGREKDFSSDGVETLYGVTPGARPETSKRKIRRMDPEPTGDGIFDLKIGVRNRLFVGLGAAALAVMVAMGIQDIAKKSSVDDASISDPTPTLDLGKGLEEAFKTVRARAEELLAEIGGLDTPPDNPKSKDIATSK